MTEYRSMYFRGANMQGLKLLALANVGRTLVFVQSDEMNNKVSKMLHDAGIPAKSTDRDQNSMRALIQYESYLSRTAALVATLPKLITGVRIKADRIVWIGETYTDEFDPRFAVYMQATARSLPHTPVYQLSEDTL